MFKWIYNFIKLSKWFIKESISFISPFTVKEIIYFPVAYIRFMKFNYETKLVSQEK